MKLISANEVNYCVLIPTFNNLGTVAQVIEEVKAYTNHILVVNDGSTDGTLECIKNIEGIECLSFPENKGKGMALRKGFEKALELGFTHAITIDSDGQHRANDLPNFYEAIKQDPNALFIGCRNMKQSNVPGSSNFGNNFSNFWFKFETGIDAPDTQSGFRSYPIHLFKNMRFFTTKYELEIEVIVRAAWRDIPIKFVPIDVYYPPQDERITHFRKIQDFTRISILNTVLVTMAIFYYKPRKLFLDLKKQKPRVFFKEYIFDSNDHISKTILAVFIGVFIGLSPFHGFKMMSVIVLSIGFKLNKAVTIGLSYISGMPPIIPLLIFVSHELGSVILQNNNHFLFVHSQQLSIQFVAENILQQLLGGLFLATAGATIFSLIIYILLRLRQKKVA